MDNNYNQFSEEQIKHNLAFNAAEANGTSVAQEFCVSGMYSELSDPSVWPNPFEDEATDEEYSKVDLIQFSGKNPLSEYCDEISKKINFPENTCFLHGLGVVSSAMNRKFKYSYYGGGEKPANLYIVTAQPPSTGKSGINDDLTDPVVSAYSRISAQNKKYRAESMIKISRLEKELAKSSSDNEISAVTDEIIKEEEFLKTVPVYVYSADDATAEGLEIMAGKQEGMFNLVSDEADAINILMGSVYGGKSSKTNHGLFLKGWDGGHLSVVRAGRETAPCYVHGTISVIAQDESINSILEAGRSGRGVSERILMLREDTRLGKREHTKRVKESPRKKEDYARLIDNIVEEQEGVVLSFSDQCIDEIVKYRNTIEPFMGNGEKYSNNLIRGVVGKADKQVFKIASVLHTCEYWKGKTPKKKTVIQLETIQRAILIFDMLINTFVDAADSKGFVGEKTELTAICDWLQAKKEKTKGNKAVTVRQLRDGIKRKEEFAGITNLTSKIREEYLPELVRRGVIVFDSKFVFINPKL